MQLTIAQIVELSKALTIVPARDQQTVVKQLCWDSRLLRPGMLFLALRGETFDGNDFIVEAFDKKAAVVIASRQVTEAERLAAVQHKAALLYAPNGVAALQRLATEYRKLLSAKTIAVTGSTGKTSTRLFVSAVLEKALITVSSTGNRNNEIGLPATILKASQRTEALVLEMAMRGLGQIEALCKIARPQVGIITNIGPAHLELLGSQENIARAKAELIEALPGKTGIAILNGDDPYTPFIRDVAQTEPRVIRVLTFGIAPQNDIHADAIEYDDLGHPTFDLVFSQNGEKTEPSPIVLSTGRKGRVPASAPASATSPSPDDTAVLNIPTSAATGAIATGITTVGTQALATRVTLQHPGLHSVYNALAAAAAGIALGLSLQQIASALERVQAAPMRQMHRTLNDGTLLIDDTYNANPDSMQAALDVLSRLDGRRPHIAVLGDMGELGPDAPSLHEKIGQIAQQTGIDMLITLGDLATNYAKGARAAGMDESRIISCTTVEEALAALDPWREKTPIILVKASRFMGFERVVQLCESYTPVPVPPALTPPAPLAPPASPTPTTPLDPPSAPAPLDPPAASAPLDPQDPAPPAAPTPASDPETEPSPA